MTTVEPNNQAVKSPPATTASIPSVTKSSDESPDQEMHAGDKSPEKSPDEDSISQSRKRSKVSRACDCCRRKKIKCNADYSTTLQRVTKRCDNCVKNQEECTFSRVPLKRGPSKGYIRDLEEKLETNGNPRVRSNSLDVNLSKPNHIILPPIDNVNVSNNNGTLLSTKVSILPSVNTLKSNPNSPSTNPNSSGVNSPPIQGPFWKVPYEMPHTHNHAHGHGSTSDASQNNSDVSRRSSVESVSSSSTNGSRSRLPSLKPSISISSSDQSNVISDSDDDFYSAASFKNSRRSSASLSPRNSISSLSSLNGRIKKVSLSHPTYSSAPTTPNVQTPQAPVQSSMLQHGLPAGLPQPISNQHLGTPQSIGSQAIGYSFPVQQMAVPPGYQSFSYFQVPQMVGNPIQQPSDPHFSHSRQQSRSQFQVIKPGSVSTSLEQNLKIYYSKFHNNFPILPFNENYIFSIIEVFNNSKLDDQTRTIIDLFNQSLQMLNNYESCNLNDCIQLIYRFLSLYPFNNFGIKLNDSILYLFFSAAILVNYAILLSGNIYSMGISICLSFFNDFKVLENFIDLFKNFNSNELSELSYDNIKLYLPKLYFCLLTIDDFYSLSFGIQKIVNNQFNDFLHSNLNYLIPSNFNNDNNFNGTNLLRMHDIINDLVVARDKVVFDKEKEFKMDKSIWNNFNEKFNYQFMYKSQKNFSVLFVLLMKDKYELLNFLIEISNLFNNLNFNSNSQEEKNEILQDHHLKLIRLVKAVTLSLTNLTTYFVELPKNNSAELITPFLNISVSQSYKLLKLSKLVIDSLLNYSNMESLNRILKINSDLLTCANNLSSTSSLDVFGSVFSKLIQSKVNSYALNFTNMPNKPNVSLACINWKFDFFKFVLPLMEKENIDGWL